MTPTEESPTDRRDAALVLGYLVAAATSLSCLEARHDGLAVTAVAGCALVASLLTLVMGRVGGSLMGAAALGTLGFSVLLWFAFVPSEHASAAVDHTWLLALIVGLTLAVLAVAVRRQRRQLR